MAKTMHPTSACYRATWSETKQLLIPLIRLCSITFDESGSLYAQVLSHTHTHIHTHTHTHTQTLKCVTCVLKF